jgi:hypothetical protein
MLRIVLGVIVGFLAWAIVWFGSEAILSALWPPFGAHQAAFQAAITEGGEFTPNTNILLIHIFLGSIVSLMSGFLTALIAGKNNRAPLILGLLLLAVGLMKAAMSWPLVPIWYHVLFTAILLPMTVLGGKLKAAR